MGGGREVEMGGGREVEMGGGGGKPYIHTHKHTKYCVVRFNVLIHEMMLFFVDFFLLGGGGGGEQSSYLRKLSGNMVPAHYD